MKIIWPPKRLESFARCECDYRLLDLQDGRYAIEWAEWDSQGGDTYAIVYEMKDQAKDDFDKLRDRGLSYRSIEERTDPENILGNPPWIDREWETKVKVVEKDDAFWNAVLLEWYDEYWAHCGPYGTVDEAAEHLADDLRRVQQEYGNRKAV